MLDELAVRERLYARLRRTPNNYSVKGSLPILFFGDLFAAHIATVGLCPSDREYVDVDGQELDGTARRFETLESLHVRSRSALSDSQCAHAVTRMEGYFQKGPIVYSFFRPLARIVKELGYTYEEREAVHLNLVQETTRPVWGRLPTRDTQALMADDVPFFQWELESFPFEVLLCNGSTVSEHVRGLTAGQVLHSEGHQGGNWWVGKGTIGNRATKLAGWDTWRGRPTLTPETQVDLARALQALDEPELLVT
jgi:hypothetical protein